MEEIKLASTEELINELADRNDSVIVGLYRKVNGAEGDVIFRYKGRILTAIGLSKQLDMFLSKLVQDTLEPLKEGE